VFITVLARSKSGEKHAHRRNAALPLVALQGVRLRELRRPLTAVEPLPDEEPPGPDSVRTTAAPDLCDDAAVVDNASRTQDQATYTCGCGFVFEAQVLTTVACPHCDAQQAW
jgi:hypothetical protein